jgi:hypothetical protein
LWLLLFDVAGCAARASHTGFEQVRQIKKASYEFVEMQPCNSLLLAVAAV